MGIVLFDWLVSGVGQFSWSSTVSTFLFYLISVRKNAIHEVKQLLPPEERAWSLHMEMLQVHFQSKSLSLDSHGAIHLSLCSKNCWWLAFLKALTLSYDFLHGSCVSVSMTDIWGRDVNYKELFFLKKKFWLMSKNKINPYPPWVEPLHILCAAIKCHLLGLQKWMGALTINQYRPSLASNYW